jgi:hypothetical protein
MGRGERKDLHTEFWWGDLRERDELEGPDIDGRIILNCIFRKWHDMIYIFDFNWVDSQWQ